MKKLISIILLVFMCVFTLAGCAGGGDPAAQQQRDLKEEQKNSDTLLSDDEICYVMIYNPKLYDEVKRQKAILNTGDIEEYIEAVVSKGEGLETPEDVIPRSVAENSDGIDLTEFDLGGNRGDVIIQPYKKGDKREFYHGDQGQYTAQMFECVYAGKNCNIWTYNNHINDRQAEDLGKEFDETIYQKTVDLFGESRFAKNGGKVNLLFYPMQINLCGFFRHYDLYSSSEATAAQVQRYKMNTDHDILHINSKRVGSGDKVYSTMAHEFQHLICFTNYFHTYGKGINMKTWLNEAMSGYVEEYLYPGSINSQFKSFMSSDRIRHGQSLYNFDTTVTSNKLDIGVYGSVYLFSEFLASLGGKEVFTSIHSYWRNSYSQTLDEAEAIRQALSSSTCDEISNIIDYEGMVEFKNEGEEWLSKLTLKFYLSLIEQGASTPEAYENVKAGALLYDEINPADIEGGGRVIAALKDGEFKFPEDADDGLVYVGFNKNFEIVTELVVR